MLTLPVPVRDAATAAGADADDLIARALRAVRDHLGMPIAYLSEFVDEDSVFRHVDAPGLEHLIAPGDRRPLDEVYCRHILSGDLPELIPDTAALPRAREMPITAQVPIGSHVSVPVHRADGSPYGMFCCLSPDPNPSLNDRDLAVMKMFAGLAADQIRARESDAGAAATARARIEGVLGGAGMRAVAQPIYNLTLGRLRGFEALARFDAAPARGPDAWFAEAEAVGMGRDLELAAVRHGLALFPDLPPDVTLSVNLAPATLEDARLRDMVRAAPRGRVVLEVTEHVSVADFTRTAEAIGKLRALGARVAIDDVGAGHAGLTQILRLAPDLLKLDRALVRDIDEDPVRRALVTAILRFASECRMRVVAEGVERAGELRTLRALGVDDVQGYLTGAPAAPGAAARRIDLETGARVA